MNGVADRNKCSPVLRVADMCFERGQAAHPSFRLAVQSLELNAGQTLGIVGPSGCGKSTLLDLLGLLRRPSRCARLELLGHDAIALWSAGGSAACARLRARSIGFVLQAGGLIPSLSLLDNLRLSPHLLGDEDSDWTEHLLGELDLRGLESRLPSELSVGQRQRVAVARAVAHRPALILADEPTASLGPQHNDDVMRLLLRLCRDCATAVVLVSHDLSLLERHRVPHRTLELQDDRIVLQATPHDQCSY